VPANLPPPWLSVQSLPSRAASAPFRPTPFLRSLIASLPLPSRPPPPNSSPFSSTPPRFASSSSVACSMLSPHQKRKERKKKENQCSIDNFLSCQEQQQDLHAAISHAAALCHLLFRFGRNLPPSRRAYLFLF
jgi:hypothetical protein